LAHYFITRPVAAMVLSLLMLLLGGLALTALPISQYPDVVPPQVVITAVYPGQSAEKVAAEVADPIEEQVNGVENMEYMESQCTNDGSMKLTVTFKIGTNPDTAQVLVQNRVAIATPKLPEVVRQVGVVTKKQSSAILLVVSVYSEDREAADPANPGKTVRVPVHSPLTVSNYARKNIKDELARIEGVGDVFLFGEREYSMRIWLDPRKMADYGLSGTDVVNQVRAQNVTVAAGQIGAPPSPAGQAFQMVINTRGRLADEKAFEQVVLKASGEQLVKLKDVVRDTVKAPDGGDITGVELGARSYDTSASLDGRPSIGMPIFQLPGANAFDTALQVQQKVAELEKKFPPGMKSAIVFNPTTFVRDSVLEVVHTLFEAVLLVAIVVMLFLQEWRAVLIPMAAIPVALVGTLAVMYGLGYSINNLSLLGMVLAIGIVVDDAIVVVEAVEYHMARGLAPQAATEKAMSEVAGAIIGVSLVLAAVFVPSTFLPGLTGRFFQQFAVVVAVSTLISAFNSLSLSPALCALLLKPHDSAHGGKKNPLPAVGVALLAAGLAAVYGGRLLAGVGGPAWAVPVGLAVAGGVAGYFVAKPLNWVLAKLFAGFNYGFDKFVGGYGWGVDKLLRVSLLVLVVYAGLLAATGYGFTMVPGGFIPQQDQGYAVVNIQLPDGASQQRTQAVVDRVIDMALGPKLPDGSRDKSKGVDGIDHMTAVTGFSIFSQANISNAAGIYISLAPFEERMPKGRTGEKVVADLNARMAEIQEGVCQAFGPPPILGLGNAGGFKLQVLDYGGLGPGPLEGQAWNLVGAASRERGIPFAFSSYTSGAPQLKLTIDTDRCFKMGVPEQAVKDTLQVYLGSQYVNDVTLDDRNWQVNVQADANYRARIEDIKAIKVRSPAGMVPLGAVIDIRETNGPTKVNRYQKFRSADVNGVTVPFLISSAEANRRVQAIAERDLPPEMGILWTDMAYQQEKAANTEVKVAGTTLFKGDTTLLIFGLSTLLAFLVLAILYESWLLPLAVVLIVPMCLLSAVVGLVVTRLDLNIFTQIGLVVLVGLACKNAILIVEYAKQKREEGMPRWAAAGEAARLRLRPILMTSFAFILSMVPLVTAAGAGAEMRRSLGTAVFAGMIGVTGFGVLFTPVFYTVIQRLRDGGKAGDEPAK
jgi:multidrug efflux pump